jgi:hypothetical protein
MREAGIWRDNPGVSAANTRTRGNRVIFSGLFKGLIPNSALASTDNPTLGVNKGDDRAVCLSYL